MILEFMANSGESFSVKEIAEHFDLPNSHACRLLKTLVDTGYVEQDKSRKYRISLQILSLSQACLSKLTVRNKAKPYLYRLIQEIGEEVYLAVPHHGQALIVDVLCAGNSNLDRAMTIGRINPPTSACGKLCGAYDDSEMEIAGKPKDAAQIRQSGYAEITRESLYAVAAPIFNYTGTFAAAVGAFITSTTDQDSCRHKLLTKTRETAEALSFALGYMSEQR